MRSRWGVVAVACLGLGCGAARVASDSEVGTETSDATTGSTETGDPTETGETSEGETTEPDDTHGIPPCDFGLPTDAGTPDPPEPPPCQPWDQTSDWSEVCFEPPVELDPAGFYFLSRVVTGTEYTILASGPDDNRLYAELEPGAEYLSLPISGTIVARWLTSDPSLSYLVTRDPHAVHLADFTLPDPIVSTLPLPAEPSDAALYDNFEPEGSFLALAVADVEGGVHRFTHEMTSLLSLGSRQLPAGLDGISGYAGTADGFRDELIAYSREGGEVWRMSPPFDDGPLVSWASPGEIHSWESWGLSDSGNDPIMLYLGTGEVARYGDFGDEEPGTTWMLDHPADFRVGGTVPFIEALLVHFVVSREAARMALFGVYGEGKSFEEPDKWVEVPADVVDGLKVGDRFLFASPTTGLTVLDPVSGP